MKSSKQRKFRENADRRGSADFEKVLEESGLWFFVKKHVEPNFPVKIKKNVEVSLTRQVRIHLIFRETIGKNVPEQPAWIIGLIFRETIGKSFLSLQKFSFSVKTSGKSCGVWRYLNFPWNRLENLVEFGEIRIFRQIVGKKSWTLKKMIKCFKIAENV